MPKPLGSFVKEQTKVSFLSSIALYFFYSLSLIVYSFVYSITLPIQLFLYHSPQCLVADSHRDRTRASVVRGRRLTAWAVARPIPLDIILVTLTTLFHLHFIHFIISLTSNAFFISFKIIPYSDSSLSFLINFAPGVLFGPPWYHGCPTPLCYICFTMLGPADKPVGAHNKDTIYQTNHIL
jgi:hypothetical protein